MTEYTEEFKELLAYIDIYRTNLMEDAIQFGNREQRAIRQLKDVNGLRNQILPRINPVTGEEIKVKE